MSIKTNQSPKVNELKKQLIEIVHSESDGHGTRVERLETLILTREAAAKKEELAKLAFSIKLMDNPEYKGILDYIVIWIDSLTTTESSSKGEKE